MMCVALGWTAVAGAGGFLISARGYPALFLLCAALTAAGSVIFLIYTRKPRGMYRFRPAWAGSVSGSDAGPRPPHSPQMKA